MRVRSVGKSVFFGAAVVACLLVSRAALGVVAVSSMEGASISGSPILLDPLFGFSGGGAGPNLGSFQGSYADSAARDGASASASASVDFGLATDVETGTIAGTFLSTVTSELTTPEGGEGYCGANSSLELIFSVPKGQQGVYRLRGSIQESDVWASGRVLLSNWDPETGEAGSQVFADSYPGGSFDLSGALAPGAYVLWVSAATSQYLEQPGTLRGTASLNLDFSVVPEPASLLMFLVVAGGSIPRRKQ